MNKKSIVVTTYQSHWPKTFEEEAQKIKTALGDNCLAIHHVGSTSVPGLSAKPVIDMIGVVKNPEASIKPLENLGYTYKGEYNIPFRYYFSRTEGVEVNLHVYEENHPEIELNLLFRDYLRAHPEACEEYAQLKKQLLQDPASFEKNKAMLTGYNLGKDVFIRKILKAAQFNRKRIMQCVHYAEYEAVKNMASKVVENKNHVYLVLYQGIEIVGYALVSRENIEGVGIDSEFMALCKKWADAK